MASTPLTPPAVAGPPLELLQRTTYLLKRLGMAVKDRSTDAFERTGVAGQHYVVLLVLGQGARGTHVTIADALCHDRSVLVGLLAELEQRGYVERKRDPPDRRRHLVSMTGAGHEAVATLRAVMDNVEREFLAPLDPEQREALHALLLQLV